MVLVHSVRILRDGDALGKEEQGRNAQAGQGSLTMAKKEIETGTCELCGAEFEVNEFNRDAPYAMCDRCFDEYLISIEDFNINNNE